MSESKRPRLCETKPDKVFVYKALSTNDTQLREFVNRQIERFNLGYTMDQLILMTEAELTFLNVLNNQRSAQEEMKQIRSIMSEEKKHDIYTQCDMILKYKDDANFSNFELRQFLNNLIEKSAAIAGPRMEDLILETELELHIIERLITITYHHQCLERSEAMNMSLLAVDALKDLKRKWQMEMVQAYKQAKTSGMSPEELRSFTKKLTDEYVAKCRNYILHVRLDDDEDKENLSEEDRKGFILVERLWASEAEKSLAMKIRL